MKDGKMTIEQAPTVSNIYADAHREDRFDARLESKVAASAGVTNNTSDSHNPIVEAVDKIHQEHLSMLEDALYRIDQILGQYK